jgi:hypothetical protein
MAQEVFDGNELKEIQSGAQVEADSQAQLLVPFAELIARARVRPDRQDRQT